MSTRVLFLSLLGAVALSACNCGSKPAVATRLVFSTEPARGIAGVPLAAVAVTLQDASGQTVKAAQAVTVTLAEHPAGAALGGTLTVDAVEGVATFDALSIARAATGYVLVASADGLESATSAAFDVGAAAAAQLAITGQPSDLEAGSVIDPPVALTLTDAFGNPVAGAAVTLVIAENPGDATLTGTTSKVTGVDGAVAFTDLSLDRVGTGYTLVATSSSLAPVATQPFDVRSGPPAALEFFVQPPPQVTSAVPMAPAVKVLARDAFGNAIDRPMEVTLALAPDGPAGTLGGTLTVPVVNGLAAFGDLTLDVAATGYALAATAPGVTGATSTAFEVVAGAPAVVGFFVQPPQQVQATSAFRTVVRVADAAGNAVSGVDVVLTLGGGPTGATLGGTMVLPTASGTADFTDLLLDRAGTGYALSASVNALTPVSSATFEVIAGPATRVVFLTQPAPDAARVPFGFDAELRDAVGNRAASTATVTVAMGNNPSGATLAGTTSVAATAGVARFTGLSIDAAGSGYTLALTSTGLAGATSAPFDLTDPGLVYVDPPAGGKLRLVRNAASSPTQVVLDLVAAVELTGYSVGFNLPLDSTRVQANGTLLTPGTALPAGSSPTAAAAVLPSTGPLASVLVTGQSQKASGTGAVATDTVIPAGSVLYTVRLDAVNGAATGVVFDGTALGPRFRARMRDKAGTDVATAPDFRIGTLRLQ